MTPFKSVAGIIFAMLLVLQSCELIRQEKPVEPSQTTSLQDSLAQVRLQQFELALEEASEKIRTILENRLPGERYTLENRALFSSVLLPRFYTSRAFRPYWLWHPDSLEKYLIMRDFIKSVQYHGLQADDYHLQAIQDLTDTMLADTTAIMDAEMIARLDVLLSDAWFMIASHIYNGKVDPEELMSQWGIQRNKPELMLDQRLAGFSGRDINILMQQFYPPHPGYLVMVAEANKLSQMEEIPLIRLSNRQLPIKPGDRNEMLPGIRLHLQSWDVYQPDSLAVSDLYDESTVNAVKQLQTRFGYQPDGVIGKLTLNAINMRPQERLQCLYVNMERLRWLPDSLEKRFVLVNIADFTLHVMEGSDTLLAMKTIVGKDYRETPVFNSSIKYLVFSPSWTVPPGIQKADLIPAAARNINYLKEKNMIVLNTRGQQVDPAKINWRRDGMRYTIRQAPGPQNALGKVKFMFPNKHNVYLHDTPSRELFARDERTLSSGCIRVEKPFELAQLLLDDMPDWTPGRIRQAMDSGIERTVVLKSPAGVYLYYLTAWADKSGKVFYRNDVYHRDDEIMAALQQKRTVSKSLIND